MQKIFPSAEAALDGLLFDGMTIAAGGFGLCGIPERLIDAIQASGVKDLTIASNNAGIDNEGLGKLLRTRQVKKMISLLRRREQGVRAAISRRRARGRVLPAGHARRADARGRCGHSRLLHQDRRRHAVAEGKEVKAFDGEDYILERGIRADLSVVKGWKADETGNLVFRKTAATSICRPRPAARSASPRSRRSCRSAASIPTASICRRST